MAYKTTLYKRLASNSNRETAEKVSERIVSFYSYFINQYTTEEPVLRYKRVRRAKKSRNEGYVNIKDVIVDMRFGTFSNSDEGYEHYTKQTFNYLDGWRIIIEKAMSARTVSDWNNLNLALHHYGISKFKANELGTFVNKDLLKKLGYK